MSVSGEAALQAHYNFIEMMVVARVAYKMRMCGDEPTTTEVMVCERVEDEDKI